MIRLFSMLAVGTLALIAISCSSTTTPAPDNAVLFPTTSGSYWVYTNTELEGDSTAPTDGAVTVDSMYVSRTGIALGGRTAAEFVTVRSDGSADTTYFSVSGAQAYQYFNMSLGGVTGLNDVDLGSKWVLVLDNNATTEWVSIDTTITDVPFDYNGTIYTGVVRVRFTGKKGASENVMVGGVSKAASAFTNTASVTASMPIPVIGTLVIPINSTVKLWFSKDVGMVQSLMNPSKVNVGIFGSFDVPGSRMNLQRYVVR